MPNSRTYIRRTRQFWIALRKENNMPRQIPSLTLSDARGLIAAGEKKAGELGIPYNIAVVDAGGGLIAHVRMDGAWLGSVDIAINKAWTARAFDMPTENLPKWRSPASRSSGSTAPTMRRW